MSDRRLFSASDHARIHKRFLQRALVLKRWMTRVVLPRCWGWVVVSMSLKALGALAEAASFLAATYLFLHWDHVQPLLPAALSNPFFSGGIILSAMILTGALLTYAGDRIGVRVSLDFERYAFVRGAAAIQESRQQGTEISREQERDILFAAPRFMARTLSLLIGAGTSIVMIFVGAVACAIIYPQLSLIIACIILITSPVYVYHALYATRIGHMFRLSARDHSEAKKTMSRKWLNAHSSDLDVFESEATANQEYMSFLDAYGQRLLISPSNQLIVNAMLALCLMAALVWIGVSVDVSASEVARIISYIIFLKLFFGGIRSVAGAVQTVASFVPNFISFLDLDSAMR